MARLREQHNALEAQMEAIRQQAVAAGRPLTAAELERFNDLSAERASVYRAWQQERLRTEPSNIITGADVFRQQARKRQLQRWGAVIIVVVLLGALRFERYNDRQTVNAGDTALRTQAYSTPVITDRQQALFDLLPPASMLPEGFETGGEWPQSIDDLGWTTERRLQLISWGFEDAVYRYYVVPEALMVSGTEGLYDFDVQLVEYGSREQAIEATRFDMEDELEISDPESKTMIPDEPPIGDLIAVISEPYVTYGAVLNWVTLWVVDGPLQYRFWAVSDDPAVPPPVMIEIAREAVALN